MSDFAAPIAEQIWDMKYRLKAADGTPLDADLPATWDRIAAALAAPEEEPELWRPRFREALEDFRFLPAGRIVAGAGTDRSVTLFNCFVMGTVEDSMAGIFDALKEAALTLQQGGGIGYDFSTIRPAGASVSGVAADASGPLSFMDVWDAMCRTIMSAGSRRGAMMATLRCDHPDIEDFVAAKSDPARLRMFNLSVLVTDPFMEAVAADADWDLIFDGTIYRSIRARDLWDAIIRATYDYAEPGVIFIDRINAANNLAYAETIAATNPCGEQPLPPYGACLLGSINLARLVEAPFTEEAALDAEALEELTGTAIRMMDNVVDASRFPLPQQAEEAKAKRRIGLGVTGLADALAMCGLRYGAPEAVEATRNWLRTIANAAYFTSARLAAEKGAFPLYDRDAILAAPMVQKLDPDVRASIGESGLRNALLTSIAPTGTISLLAGNVSSGIEPIFATEYTRKVLQPDGTRTEEVVQDFAIAVWRKLHGDAPLPDSIVSVGDLEPGDHVAMQAAAQEWVDSSISKTINVPADISFEAFKDVYTQAWRTGCKGCTTYRPNDVTGSVLSAAATEPASLANRLAGIMKQRDLKPATLSKMAGLNRRAVTDILEGRSKSPKLQTVTALAAALDVPISSLASDEVHPATSQETAPASAGPDNPIVRLFEPLDRPAQLTGETYKIKWPMSEHALYITINDIELDGQRRPFEIFVNSKNMEHFAWTVALTRMISAVFRRGGDVSFVVEELKAVFDPRGGAWMQGRYVPSILAAIGGVIERHMVAIGFLSGEGLGLKIDPATPADRPVAGPSCPNCGSFEVHMVEGCATCAACGFSKCG
ncbi:adenosylcobalamin-dependent ribonucleoside-diphosphate reductase [Jannaschia formosa]|uniref:adenosylcobalamin-dependent ribonucleoside-diphosphate reductase n=1 Tax=Jannaschia formosa TaxID=2259592 RepID=UPI000E1B9F20|nr:adenosylcobalamin-dependent ribonucleoside-diphosphate reductase [Jannaschia formosa]TFL17737.1 adenosylcobalamin-dependent ribonucleoside-diphosphate reductase [Jannaschia formosa]